MPRLSRLAPLALLALALLLTGTHPGCHPGAPFAREGVLYVGGQPVIPTGVYFWPDVSAVIGRNPFEDVASYGFDLLVAYYEYVRPDRTITNQPDVYTLRAECERLAIDCFVGAPGPEDLAGRSDAELEALFAATTDALAGSPHFLGWMFDEPIWIGIDLALMERAAAAIRRHPARPLVWINFAPVDTRWEDPDWPDMARYAGLADVVSFDFYPVATGLPWPGFISKSQLEDFGWYVERLRGWVGPEKPIWAIQQGHRVGDLDWPPRPTGRRPDAVETRFMSLQALVYGATGLVYFPGSRLGHAIPFHAPAWDVAIRDSAEAVRALRPWLASPERPQAIATSHPELRAAAWQHRGRTLVIAVREGGGPPLEAEILLGRMRRGSFRVQGEGRLVHVSRGHLADAFPGYAARVYVEVRGKSGR
jgi:hypothetical protein